MRDAGIRANKATFLTFLLKETDAAHLRDLNNGSYVANEFLTNNNILTNVSSIDRLTQFGGENALMALIPNIVEEVMRNLENGGRNMATIRGNRGGHRGGRRNWRNGYRNPY